MSNVVKVLLVGGGSGGHLTPLLAVSKALKKLDSSINVGYVGQRGETLREVMDHDSINETYQIFAGKFRRYHGAGFISHVLDVKTQLLNVRDLFYFTLGTIQAWFLLGRLKPSVIFLKGGFVSVPIGIAARYRKIPYITHDSDAIPGLANRITAKHASKNTTAMPIGLYPYDKMKTIQVGIPIRDEFSVVDLKAQNLAKSKLGISKDTCVILVTGGGNGASNLNNMVIEIARDLIKIKSNLLIVHVCGKKLYEQTEASYKQKISDDEMSHIKLIGFTNEMFNYSAAAELIICRGGATNIAEFSTQAKACIVVPNPLLTGGQQTKNANILKDKDAAVIVDENDQQSLLRASNLLLSDESMRIKLGWALHDLFVSDAGIRIARILMEIARK